jgi:Sec-independent protein translocase protein TatA
VFGINMLEAILIGLLVLLVFGPARLPDLARELAAFGKRSREAAEDFSAVIAQPDNYPDEWFATGPEFQEAAEDPSEPLSDLRW